VSNKRRKKRPAPRPGNTLARTNAAATERVEQTPNRIVATSVTFTGPLPPPDMLRAYDDIHPGLAAKIVEQFEEQGRHRRDLEHRVVTGNVRAQDRGQWLGFASFVSVVVAAVILGLAGHERVALAVVGMDLAGFGGLYVYGRREQRRERDET
jgi:uncharacterized membrane protein